MVIRGCQWADFVALSELGTVSGCAAGYEISENGYLSLRATGSKLCYQHWRGFRSNCFENSHPACATRCSTFAPVITQLWTKHYVFCYLFSILLLSWFFLPLGHFFVTFGPEFHLYTCMHAFVRLIASHYTVKVHDVTAKRCTPIDQRQAPE